jgi:hypothetical protein
MGVVATLAAFLAVAGVFVTATAIVSKRFASNPPTDRVETDR